MGTTYSTPEHHPEDAGRSAFRMARTLRREELRAQHQRAWRLLPLAAAGGVAIASALNAMVPGAPTLCLIAGLLLPLSVARRLYQPGPQVRRWRQGAAGERRTARLLAGLTRRGWVILHDRAIPGSTANLDHLALLPDGLGAVLIDTKTVNPRLRATITLRGTTVRVGDRPFTKQADTIRWEAEQAAKALGVSVARLVVIHGAKVPRKGIRTPDGLLIVAPAQLHRTLRAIPHQRRPEAARDLAERAEATLPRHSAN